VEAISPRNEPHDRQYQIGGSTPETYGGSRSTMCPASTRSTAWTRSSRPSNSAD